MIQLQKLDHPVPKSAGSSPPPPHRLYRLQMRFQSQQMVYDV